MKDLEQWLEDFQANLVARIQGLPGIHSPLQEAMVYALSNGGKRIRPLLVYAVAGPQANQENLMTLAGAIEMIHTYSLVHDDLPAMDDDDMRRGKPSLHKAFSEATAILAGDGLLTQAFLQIAQSSLTPDQALAAIRILGQASGIQGMIAGQVLDIEGETKVLAYDALEDLHQKKTGALLQAAIELGLTLSPQSQAAQAALRAYGYHFGLAFQIQNDLQDVLWDPSQTGKAKAGDQALEKNTYPSLLGLEGAKEALDHELTMARQALTCPDLASECQDLLTSFLGYLAI